MELARKVYVEVEAQFDTDGNVRPLSIRWEDGTRYYVERVVDVRRAASFKAGCTGMRYLVQIGRHRSYIWREQDDRWFVEAKSSSF